MSDLRIRVGASLDASIDTVFPSIAAAAKRTRRAVETEMNAAGASAKRLGDPYRTAGREMEKSMDGATKGARRAQMAMGALADGAKEKFAALSAGAKRLPADLSSVAREAERELKRIERASARTALGLSNAGGGGGGRGGGVGYWSMRNFAPVTPTLSIAKRLAGDVARGVGVNFDTSSMIQSYVGRQKLATDIANSGYQPGQAGAAGRLQNSGDIGAEASRVASATATDPTKALEGLQKFVAITGDLETGRAILGDMAKLARATGSNLETVVDAAGEVSAKLGDIPDKANVINAVMRQIGGAGKMGAVEMRDFAAQLGKISGLASRFSGDRAQNIGEMGILMQLARQKGGSGSASQAATAVTGFVAAMRTPANLKHYEELTGHSAYVDKNKTQMASPEALILKALESSKGSQPALAKIFSKRAMDVVGGAANVYNEAGGGKAGTAAVVGYFADLRKATMSAADVDAAFARSMETAEAKAQRFQNQLQDIADKTATKLIPALERLEPQIERAASAFGDFITWATEHPGQAIAVALAASIAKASIENVLRVGIERMMGGGKAGSAAGGAGAMGAIGALAMAGAAGWTVGTIIADKIVGDMVSAQDKQLVGAIEGTNAGNESDESKLLQDIADQQKRAADAKAQIGEVSFGESLLNTFAKMTGQGDANGDRDQGQKDNAKLQLEVLQRLEEHLAAIRQNRSSMVLASDAGHATIPIHADQSGRMPANR